MARRKKNDKKYNDRLYLRCMSDQKSLIKTRSEDAGFDNVNSYILAMALDGQVIVNDNSIDFSAYMLIHRLREVGIELDKLLHRANIHYELPGGLRTCLEKVKNLLVYTEHKIRFHDDYVRHLSEGNHKTEEWKGKTPAAIHPKLGFQINRLWNNINQFHVIAEQLNMYPHELAVCKNKAERLLERFINSSI